MITKEYFENLLDQINLKIGDDERELIKQKHKALREELREKLNLQDDFLTGSYKRNTLIKPKDETEKFDVDIFIAFSNDEYGETDLSDLRNLVIDALNNIKKSNTDLDITHINDNQKRSVGVEFNSNFQIDIVPAIEIKKDKLYKIFDRRTLEAIRSNPKLHGELLSKANEDSDKLLVPIIKILKSWKREKCDYLKSFHLELVAVKIFTGNTINSISEGLATFFDSAPEYFEKACLTDPANEKMLIDEYLDKDNMREKIITLTKREKDIAEIAIEAEKSGNENSAVANWKDVFTGNNIDDDTDKNSAFNTSPTVIKSPYKPWCDVT